MNKCFLVVLPFLTACAELKELEPFVGYTHLDTTPLNNDKQAYDFGCGGVKYRKAIELSAAACAHIRGGDKAFRFDAEYVWRK